MLLCYAVRIYKHKVMVGKLRITLAFAHLKGSRKWKKNSNRKEKKNVAHMDHISYGFPQSSY